MGKSYLDRVLLSYQGEVFGEAIFRELAEKAADPEIAYKWRVLEQLERETKERLKPLVADLGGDTAEDPASFTQGEEYAAKWAAQSWDEVMLDLQKELPQYVRFFEKLEADARPEDRAVLAAVTAHEKAIAAFADLEVAGRGEASAEPVLALLENPPTREV